MWDGNKKLHNISRANQWMIDGGLQNTGQEILPRGAKISETRFRPQIILILMWTNDSVKHSFIELVRRLEFLRMWVAELSTVLRRICEEGRHALLFIHPYSCCLLWSIRQRPCDGLIPRPRSPTNCLRLRLWSETKRFTDVLCSKWVQQE
jgi:hypothetical protein